MLEFKYPLLFLLLFPFMILPFLFLHKMKWKQWRERLLIASLRAIIFSLLIVALTVPSLLLPQNHKQIIFLVDRSKSVDNTDDEVFTWLEKSLEHKDPDDEFAILTFNEEAFIEQNMTAEPRLLLQFSENEKNQETNIENGLQLAASVLGNRGGRIVLFSDGNETKGVSMEAAKLLKEYDIQIDYVPLQMEKKEDMALTELSVSETMYQGEIAKLTVRIRSNVEKTAELRITLNDQDLIKKNVHVKEGENIFTFSHKIENTGLFIYKGEIIPKNDVYVENNRLYAMANVKGTPKILVVEKEKSVLSSIIKNAGYIVETILPEQLPTSLSHYLQYESILFNNISGTELTEKQMTLIEQAVKDFAIGFIMFGGMDSFGLGGYFKTPIERVLPVDMEIKGKSRLPTLGLVIVLDRSGSMEGRKILLAKEAASRSVLLLREEDTLGFIAFDDKPWTIVKTGPIKNKDEVISQIRSVTAGGGTNIYSPLSLAYSELMNLDLERKHIILLTDGESNTDGDYFSLIQSGLTKNITLSTVAIGQDANHHLLKLLAEEGKGRYYDVLDETMIPSILTRETVMMTRTYIEDDPFYPTIMPVNDWADLFLSGVPKMNAYIATTPKPTAQIVMKSKKDDPVLAEWKYGLGTTIAFTSDVTGKWSGDFPLWENWERFLVKMVDRTLPQYDREPISVTVKHDEENAILSLKTNSEPISQIEAVIRSQDGEEVDINSKLVAPNEYEIEFANEAGLYFLNVRQIGENGETKIFQTGFSVPYSKEYSLEGTNETKLSELAKLTGGKKLKDPSEAFRTMKTQNFVHKDITPWILLFAFLLLFIELVIRRFGLVTIRNYFGNLRLGAKQRQNPQASTADQLLKKQRKKKMKTQKPSSKNEKAMDKLDENKEKEISETFPTPNQGTISSHNKNDLPSKKLMDKENQDISREERLKRLIEAKKRKGR